MRPALGDVGVGEEPPGGVDTERRSRALAALRLDLDQNCGGLADPCELHAAQRLVGRPAVRHNR